MEITMLLVKLLTKKKVFVPSALIGGFVEKCSGKTNVSGGSFVYDDDNKFIGQWFYI